MMKKSILNLMICGMVVLPVGAHAQQWEALPKQAPSPASNPQTDAKVALGKVLFFDPRLSEHGTMSCNSCHNVMAAGDDNRPNSIGMHDARGGRSAPSVWNAAFLSAQFWDGRAPTLEDQAKGPITNPIEMGMSDAKVTVARLKAIPGYLPLFKTAFPNTQEPINIDNVAKAIAAYERTLINPDTPYDRHVRGDKTALDAQQLRGMQTFAEVGCNTCHSGANFSGPPLPAGQGFFMRFPNVAGSEYDKKYDLLSDTGRQSVTGQEDDRHLWRVPTLRNIALTAPYLHNGKVPTLDEAVRVMAKTQLNKDLSQTQVKDLVAFLGSLGGNFPQQTMPRLPLTAGSSVIPPVDPHLEAKMKGK